MERSVSRFTVRACLGRFETDSARDIRRRARHARPMTAASEDRLAWTRPGAFEVAKGVYRIPLPMPEDGLTAINVYAIEDGKGLTLVDGGWAVAPARRELEAALKQLGATPRSITRILVTHAHRDHYTLAVELRRDYGTPISLGIGEKISVEGVGKGVVRFAPQLALLREAGAEELAWQIEHDGGAPEPTTDWEPPDEWLDEGQVDVGTRQLRIVSTPGHTRGHVVFIDEDAELLLAGDHVLPHITPSIGFEPFPLESPLQDYLDSLRKVRALPDLKLLPAHGPAAPSVHARVDELMAHHEARFNEIRVVMGSHGWKHGYEVAQALGWTRRKKALLDMDLLNQMLAVNETVHHLRVLEAQGELEKRSDSSGVVLFQKVP
jgi:glyoxylase-like metal-dependent hydrolase (beta-lactamase superfamily II)